MSYKFLIDYINKTREKSRSKYNNFILLQILQNFSREEDSGIRNLQEGLTMRKYDSTKEQPRRQQELGNKRCCFDVSLESKRPMFLSTRNK